MRIERSVTTVSWIPSDLLEGTGRLATRLKLAKHDRPPPDRFEGGVHQAIEGLRQLDRFRFANELRAYIDVEEGAISGWGYSGGGLMGATTIQLGVGAITVPAVQLPDRTAEPEVGPTSVRFVQTVGGRTGAPMPRVISHRPFVQYVAPIVWTTLELTIDVDGSHRGNLIGASDFPRHWVFNDDGALVAKSSVADYRAWMNESFGRRTPWGEEDSPAFVTEVESLLERQLQETIMRGGSKPEIRRVNKGEALVEQGEAGHELFLLLNGVLVVDVDGELLAEVGPGAVLGERAVLEGGRRTSTLRAVTDCKVAAVPADQVDREKLAALAAGHRREESAET